MLTVSSGEQKKQKLAFPRILLDQVKEKYECITRERSGSFFDYNLSRLCACIYLIASMNNCGSPLSPISVKCALSYITRYT